MLTSFSGFVKKHFEKPKKTDIVVYVQPAAAAGFDSVGLRSKDCYPRLWIYRHSSSIVFVLNVCITKGVSGVPFNTLDIFQRSQNRNDMVEKLRDGRFLRSLMPRRADPTSSIWNEGIRGWVGFAECVVGDILLCVSGDWGWFLLACKSAWISCTSKTKPSA